MPIKFFYALLILTLFFPLSSSFADKLADAVNAVGNTASSLGKSVGDTIGTVTGDRTPAMIRKEIDQNEPKALTRLFREKPGSRKLYDRSYGYAIFSTNKKGLMLSSTSGVGVAVQKDNRARTYMRMAALGANVGGGIQYYQLIFLFENKSDFRSFVDYGWEVGGAADAVVGKDTVNAAVNFVQGKAIYQLQDTGIMLGADLSGTKYWKDSSLNKRG